MAEIFKSTFFFLWGIIKRVYIWGYALIVDPFDLCQKFLNESTFAKYKEYIDMPTPWAILIFISLIAWAAIMTYHEERKQNLGPRLKIEYKKKEKGYYNKAYSGLYSRGLASLPSDRLAELHHDLHCISIKNLSTKECAKSISVEIVDIEPENTYIRNEFDIKLRFRDDKQLPFDLEKDINPGITLFVMVIRMNIDDFRIPMSYEFLNSEGKNTMFSLNCNEEEYTITIRASGENVPAVTKKFKFGCTNVGGDEFYKINLWFKPV